MAEFDVSFGALANLRGGAFAAEVDIELGQLVRDMELRPRDKKVRKLLIEVELEPVAELDDSDRLQLEGAVITARVSGKVPKISAKPVVAKLVRDPSGRTRLAWQDDSPNNPRQGSLLDDLEQRAEEGAAGGGAEE